MISTYATLHVLLLSVVLGLITYRVARFIALDTLIEGTRDRVHSWLERHIENIVWRKLLELLGCPFCITIWVSAATVAVTHWLVGSFPMPVWVWLGAATVALIPWQIIDEDD